MTTGVLVVVQPVVVLLRAPVLSSSRVLRTEVGLQLASSITSSSSLLVTKTKRKTKTCCFTTLNSSSSSRSSTSSSTSSSISIMIDQQEQQRRSYYWYNCNIIQQQQQQRQQQQQQYYVRYLSNTTRSRKKKGFCPYGTLGVETDIEYKLVKKAFLRIAMKHHPDTAGHDTSEEKSKAKEIFINARHAFESIVELPCGGSGLKEEHSEGNAEDFDTWFNKETGLNPFDINLDSDTLKEIADVSASQAGLDRGGMWHMAQALTQGLNTSALGGQQPLKLEQGVIQKDGTKKIRRIRRK